MEADAPREAGAIAGVPAPEHRPSVVGHEEVLAAIRERLAARTLPGAILLHGPEGIGKATLAFAVAREVLAATGDETPGRVAAQIVAGSHPNLFTLRRRMGDNGKFYTVIRVADVRALRDRLHQTRGRAGHRVVVVDSLDDCNASSANALLKVLEEPPPDTLFLAVSHRPGGLLPTIRSRCIAYALRPLSGDAVRAVIAATLPDAASGDVDKAVALADGRPRRALEALLLGGQELLRSLERWLEDPTAHPPAAHLLVADALAAASDGAEQAVARHMLMRWMASEAERAARLGGEGRARLVSASELWEKARMAFSEAEIYNLDQRQTLTMILDAIRRHALRSAPAGPVAVS